MSDTTWAAKVLDGVGRIWAYSYEVNEADNGAEPEDWKTFQTWDVADPYPILGKEYVAVDDALAALTAQNREMALDVLASSGQAAEAYAAQLAAEAEAAALRAKVARLEGALTDMPKAVLRTTVCQGPVWPDDRPGVWLAALEACAKSVREAVDAALTDGGKDGGKHE